MLLDFQNTKHWPVETESGQYLGHIESLQWEAETGQVQKLLVVDKKLIVEKSKYLISYDQILRIENEKVIVKNNTVKQAVRSREQGLNRQSLPAEEQMPLSAEEQIN